MVRCDVQRWNMQKQIDATRYIVPCIWHAIRHTHGYDMIPLRGNTTRFFLFNRIENMPVSFWYSDVITMLRWSIKILKYTAVCWQLDILVRSSDRISSKWPYWIRWIACDIMIVYVGRHGEASEIKLLCLWTKAAMMLDWGSSTLNITTARVVGISHCWYGLGYCTVLMLAVLTDGRWKLAATYCSTIRCHHCGMML